MIVVLGAAVRPDGAASPALRRRVARAVAAARAWPDAPVVLSGGHGRRHPAGADSEARVMAALARAEGLAPDRLILEARSSDTLQNAGQSLAIAASAGAGRVLVVTDGPHLPRALLAFRAVADARGLSMRLEGAAAPGPDGRARRLAARLREAAARLVYRWRLARGSSSHFELKGLDTGHGM
ncbi:YdcF family protein [Roseospira visakhapatnamensis]|uniref:DUF218 domain-containing protein n=1 Tax=Roseospira visakhapatnamensis TaxID=390880 RepID=A0A7W6RC51_9PROT|nr:YdcF family protein [Roseospira visakhapatnamensis]MBB4265259.1 hypothetical protein [Roseospira visakhapatnamensis]